MFDDHAADVLSKGMTGSGVSAIAPGSGTFLFKTMADNVRGPSYHASNGDNANDPNGRANIDATTRPSRY